MTNYTKNVDYAAKDALAHRDPSKTIYGADLDAEFVEIQTAIATKYQSSDIATQSQAEAGTNNTTLMTPLRVSQYLTGAGGGSGAGVVGDLVLLADPNADRILFWDDSVGAAAFLAASTGLAISGTNLTVNPSEVDHNALLNYDANRHIDHTAVSISTGSGLTGGGTIASTRTLSLDINGLTTDNTVDYAVDYFPYYDAGEGANNKVLASEILGVALGDGRWYRNAAQAIPAAIPTTIIYDTEVYNALTRGTYSTSTGIYTAGASGARLLVSATFTVATLGASRSMTILGQSTGGEAARASHTNQSGTETTPTVTITFAVSLAAAETCYVHGFVTTTANATVANSAGPYNVLSIVELA